MKCRNSLSAASTLNKQSQFHKVILLGMAAHTCSQEDQQLGLNGKTMKEQTNE